MFPGSPGFAADASASSATPGPAFETIVATLEPSTAGSANTAENWFAVNVTEAEGVNWVEVGIYRTIRLKGMLYAGRRTGAEAIRRTPATTLAMSSWAPGA